MYIVTCLQPLRLSSSVPRYPMRSWRWPTSSWQTRSASWSNGRTACMLRKTCKQHENNVQVSVSGVLRTCVSSIYQWWVDIGRNQAVLCCRGERGVEVRHSVRLVWHTDHHTGCDLLQHQEEGQTQPQSKMMVETSVFLSRHLSVFLFLRWTG